MVEGYRDWHHSPSHLFEAGAAYFVTAGTYQKAKFFDSPEKCDFLVSTLFDEAKRFDWKLEAWAVMSNHYHFVGTAPDDASTLRKLVTALHSKSAIWLNRVDGASGRKVWFQYRDTCLTYQKSYLARLNYVHNNPVKHGLVGNAENYKWCSMSWFMNESEPGFRKTVMAIKSDRVNIDDDY